MPHAAFGHSLRTKQPLIGLWLALANPYSAEVCATAGFDWLLIDGEHAPNDLREILAQLQVLTSYETCPVVRPLSGDRHMIKQLLDIGAQTLLIPMVESAAQASELVRAMRYPPRGVRGVGSALARASRWNQIPNYLHTAERDLCLLVQIESRLGVTNLESIVSVEGVDGVFIGPSDLAAALGHIGDPQHEGVQEVIGRALDLIRKSGKAAGILSNDVDMARRYIDMGFQFVAVGIDVSLLTRAAHNLVSTFRARK